MYPNETESQPNISEWRKHISEPDARAELLLSKPYQVNELLDDLVFIQPFVWLISFATYLDEC
jgi:hypothetical protein